MHMMPPLLRPGDNFLYSKKLSLFCSRNFTRYEPATFELNRSQVAGMKASPVFMPTGGIEMTLPQGGGSIFRRIGEFLSSDECVRDF